VPTRTATSGSARQIDAFAKAAGSESIAEFYDQAVSGTDPIDVRPGFAAMPEQIASNGVRAEGPTSISSTVTRRRLDRRYS
jgi:hypothetical protein